MSPTPLAFQVLLHAFPAGDLPEWGGFRRNGGAGIADSPEALHSLWSLRREAAAPALVDERGYARAVRGGGDVFLITAAPVPELVDVRDDGAPRVIGALDPDGEPALLSVVPSPDGRSVALGVVPESDFFGRRRLVVLDRATGEERLRIDGIECRVSPLSSFAPVFEIEWLDAATVRFSETVLDETGEDGFFRHVDVDVETGERLREAPYTDRLGLHHEPIGALSASVAAPAPTRSSGGRFELHTEDVGARLLDTVSGASSPLSADLDSFRWLPGLDERR